MTDIDKFNILKDKILLKYQESYPFSQGNWKNFSSQDIKNLIGLLEESQNQTVSEKWIYTHLKPATNDKLPRKSMLDIFSVFVGYSGWDELCFNYDTPKEITTDNVEQKDEIQLNSFSKYKKLVVLLISALVVCFSVYYILLNQENEGKVAKKQNVIELKDKFTKEKIDSEDIKIYKEKENGKELLEINDSEIQLELSENQATKLIIESPYYKEKAILVEPNLQKEGEKKQIELNPDDYALMLKAFMLSDIKDWKTRKEQLNKILADNLEVIVMLKNNLGAEYFNKKEFSEQLILPTEMVRKMKIVEIQNDQEQKIKFIRIVQE